MSLCAPLKLGRVSASLQLCSINQLMACFLVPLHRAPALVPNRWRRRAELIPHSIWRWTESEAEFCCVVRHGGGAFAFRLPFQRCSKPVSLGQLNRSTPTTKAALSSRGMCYTPMVILRQDCIPGEDESRPCSENKQQLLSETAKAGATSRFFRPSVTKTRACSTNRRQSDKVTQLAPCYQMCTRHGMVSAHPCRPCYERWYSP